MNIVLASSSSFRKELLQKLGLQFSMHSPDIDEKRLENEHPQDLVHRLAVAKAKEVAKTKCGIIIASDQVAVIGDNILSKPHTKENAIAQLQYSAGKKVDFLTSLCVLNTTTNQHETIVETFSVYFKKLNLKQITNYIEKEDVLQCVGSFKSEGLGIALFEKLEGEDPNSLIGLPLIRLIVMLEKQQIYVL